MHHAELIIGTLEDATRTLAVSLAEGNPDVRVLQLDRLGIDEARMIVHEAALLPVQEEFRTFIIAFREATLEAQNALLKTLEEPPHTTRFYIIVPREDSLIATVRSRLLRVESDSMESASSGAAVQTFLKQSYADRLSDIALKAKVKDTLWMEEILRGLEQEAGKKKDEALMRAVIKTRMHFASSGASKKMLLEHLALIA